MATQSTQTPINTQPPMSKCGIPFTMPQARVIQGGAPEKRPISLVRYSTEELRFLRLMEARTFAEISKLRCEP